MESHKNGLILPKDANGHDYVEIAGIKWATMNVGANSVTDYGKYFQWGDTQGYTKDEIEKEHKKQFALNWSDYKFNTDGDNIFTKYNSTDGYKELTLDDDAVHAAWKGSWRMPTIEEFEGIGNAVANGTVVKQLATKNEVYGILLAEGDKELFLPACGLAYDGAVHYSDVYGDYWLSSLSTDFVSDAYSLYFSSDDVDVGNYYRLGGRCVRGVLADK